MFCWDVESGRKYVRRSRPRGDHLPGDSEGGAESRENQSGSLSYSPAGRNKFRCGRDKTLPEGAKENGSSSD
jgi:hypothetical protein